MTGDEAVIWVDASSLALGAALEVDGEIIEDGCWLRPSESAHINMAELDAVIRGINLAVSWSMQKLTLKTDSRTVYHWLTDVLSGASRLKTRAASEMLIRRRLATVKSIVNEYDLQLDVQFVPSADNRADALTRVPMKWLASAGNLPVLDRVAATSAFRRRRLRTWWTSGHQAHPDCLLETVPISYQTAYAECRSRVSDSS